MSHFSNRLAARTAQQIENAIHVHEYRHARLPRLGLPVGSGGTSTGTGTGTGTSTGTGTGTSTGTGTDTSGGSKVGGWGPGRL